MTALLRGGEKRKERARRELYAEVEAYTDDPDERREPVEPVSVK